MAPVPYTPNGRLDLLYSVNTLSHRATFPVDITPVGGGFEIVGVLGSTVNAPPLTIADMAWTLISAFYPNTVLTPGWVLYSRTGLAFTPVDSGSASGGPGTNGAGVNLGTQLTFTFADDVNHRVNHMLFETSYPAPGKSIVNATPASFAAYIASLDTPSGAATNLCDYVHSRGDGIISRSLRWTNTLSRAVRKRRGLA